METLDYYDQYMTPLGTENRDVIHAKGLWHKTIHCWLYDKKGNIYFQIRTDSGKLYTTASGHVLAGETVNQAFQREIKEEIGVDITADDLQMVEINVWQLDKLKNGKKYSDRAFSNVYLAKIAANFEAFTFDESEVLGIVKVNAAECLDLLKSENRDTKIKAVRINNFEQQNIEIKFDDFLIFPGELGLLKYGKVLQAVINNQK